MDYLIPILLGFLGGLLPYAGLARKLWNLQCDLKSTQVQLLKERNTRAADTRWKDKALLDELEQAKNTNGQPTFTKPVVDPLAKFRRV